MVSLKRLSIAIFAIAAIWTAIICFAYAVAYVFGQPPRPVRIGVCSAVFVAIVIALIADALSARTRKGGEA